LLSLTLCADDYGLNPEVNDAIHALIHAGRLNAVSCMTVGSAVEAQPLLETVANAPLKVQVGLHLTLTEYTPLDVMPKSTSGRRFPEVGSLLAKSHLRQIDRTEITAELNRQFDAFEDAFGRIPDFVDGHQHVHIFPGIRHDVIKLMIERMGARGAEPGWSRCCDAPTIDLLRIRNPRAILLAMMARRQRNLLQPAGLRFNDRFYGVNGFDPNQPFRTLMQGWLKMVVRRSTSALIMCHPGRPSSDPDDPIAARRPDELAYLSSDDFAEDLAAHGLTLE